MSKTKSFNFRKFFRLSVIVLFVFIASVIALNTYVYGAKDSKDSNSNVITTEEVVNAQTEWAAGIVEIGKAYAENKDYAQIAKNLIDKLYAYDYGEGIVLFKPTKAADVPFRITKKSALSYFIDGNIKHDEDDGFAIHPWTKVVFNDDKIMYFHGDIAIAMGTYSFTDTKGDVTKVEYTFGYIKPPQGQLKIVLHHSSLPYKSN
ncbi:hypothetical protein L3V82_12055 [Thiotrichales bacterium 19S3-7]|nr:hypothetical protein [Thiotrichales bacterium 19S3-7]MCF6802927.1 hypothetical protein [Thiotrichales bacterium 19S3-11]